MSEAHEPTIEELKKLLEEEEWEQDVRLEKLREHQCIAQECKEAAERKKKAEEEQKLGEEHKWRTEALQRAEEEHRACEKGHSKRIKEAWEAQEKADCEARQKADLEMQETANLDTAVKAWAMNAEFAKQQATGGKLKSRRSHQQPKKLNVAWKVWNEEWSKKPSMEEDKEVAKGPCDHCSFWGDWCILRTGTAKVEMIILSSSDNEDLRLKKAKGTPLKLLGSKPTVEIHLDLFEGFCHDVFISHTQMPCSPISHSTSVFVPIALAVFGNQSSLFAPFTIATPSKHD
ncbi:hypothetical protein JB92DRAFT_3116526 [Gautieria morchelliformis]|nr:hypothetical protein JB92DRAFT_3116526 [Gautieria morchelliformis]